MPIVGSTPSPAEPVPEEFDLVCEHCGYSLVGLIDSTRCPECGREFDPKQLPLARVPWLYRKRLGTLAAYWQTIRLIRRDPKAFALELCRPVRISKTDAQKFRRMTIYVVMFTIISLLAGICFFAIAENQRIQARVQDYLVYGGMSFLLLLAVWIALRLCTDMPTFIWKGLPADPMELTPLHHYACAPLAIFPLPVLIGVLATVFYMKMPDVPLYACAILLIAVIMVLLLLYRIWRLPQIFMRVATQCGKARIVGLGIYLPLHWLLMWMMGMGIAILLALTMVMMFHLD